jgi:hypothetical protein
MLKLTKSLLFVGVFLATTSAATAGDPPQALGLVATAEPIPIHCEGAECSVNLSAFCLQQKRRSPAPSDLYRQATAGAVQVSARTLGGAQVILDEKDLTFRPDPEYTSVRVSIPRAAVTTLDIKTLRLTVGRRASLLPIEAPASAGLDAAIGPHREIAARFFEKSDSRAKAVHMVNRLINELPRTSASNPSQRHSAWEKASNAQPNGDERQWVDELYRNCGKAADASPYLSVRQCLADWHHRSLSNTNKSFWSALAGV